MTFKNQNIKSKNYLLQIEIISLIVIDSKIISKMPICLNSNLELCQILMLQP